MSRDCCIKRMRGLRPKGTRGSIRFWTTFFQKAGYIPLFADYATNIAIEAELEKRQLAATRRRYTRKWTNEDQN